MPAQLRPLADTLCSGNPWSMIPWLRRSGSAKVLAELAAVDVPITHELLDDYSQDCHVAYARELLITAEILAPRPEQFAQLELWIDRAISDLPRGQGRIIRPFAEWDVLRDARRRANRGAYSSGAATADRDVIRTAIMFLCWLETINAEVTDVTQQDLDRWLELRPTRRNQIGAFLRWTNARAVTNLEVPKRRSGQPARFQSTEEHLAQLRRCLTDDALPLDLRVIGSLIRLYALPLSRILRLQADNVFWTGGRGYLAIGSSPVLLPPVLADLIDQQISQPPTASTYTSSSARPANHLFPGRPPSRPRSNVAVQRQLKNRGLPTIQARNTAMIEAVTELPPLMVSDLFGLHPRTAGRWAKLAQANWADYLAARIRRGHPGSGKVPPPLKRIP